MRSEQNRRSFIKTSALAAAGIGLGFNGFAENLGSASKQLFAEGMIRFTKICKDLPGLNSYWKANQAQLDDLKKTHPELYKDVRDAFTELKAQFKTGESQ